MDTGKSSVFVEIAIADAGYRLATYLWQYETYIYFTNVLQSCRKKELSLYLRLEDVQYLVGDFDEEDENEDDKQVVEDADSSDDDVDDLECKVTDLSEIV